MMIWAYKFFFAYSFHLFIAFTLSESMSIVVWFVSQKTLNRLKVGIWHKDYWLIFKELSVAISNLTSIWEYFLCFILLSELNLKGELIFCLHPKLISWILSKIDWSIIFDTYIELYIIFSYSYITSDYSLYIFSRLSLEYIKENLFAQLWAILSNPCFFSLFL